MFRLRGSLELRELAALQAHTPEDAVFLFDEIQRRVELDDLDYRQRTVQTLFRKQDLRTCPLSRTMRRS